jgi:hypothetical protein
VGRTSRKRSAADELRAAAFSGDANAFRGQLAALLTDEGLAALDQVRRGDLLLACHSPPQRAQIRRAYLETLLERRVLPALLRREAIYLSYCEVIGTLRDEVVENAKASAAALSRLGFTDGIEACALVVASAIRRFIRLSIQAHASDPDRSGLNTAATLSEVSHEIGGLHSLLPHMIRELHNSINLGRQGEEQPLPCAAVAARRLFRTAEHWQSLNYVRQRVSFDEVRVERVEQGSHGAHLFVAPTRILESWRHQAAERRLAGMRMTRRLSEGALRAFPIDLVSLTKRAFLAAGAPTDEVLASTVMTSLLDEISASIRALDIVMITQAQSEVAALTLAIWAAHLLVQAIDLLAHAALKNDALNARRWPFTLIFTEVSIRAMIAESAHVSPHVAIEALAAVTSDAAERHPLDMSTRPFLKVGPGLVAYVRNPFGLSDPFMETRRILASRNATSGFLGAAYEKHIRSLMVAGGFVVAPGRVVLESEGNQVTDVDVLAYKDGVVFVMQAKCLPEPDSTHSLWKAREQIDAGIRQCLMARAHLSGRRTDVSSILAVRPENVRELCCVVVSPCLRFSGDSAWPVAVVDDMYLDHVLTVGEVRRFNHSGQVVQRERLYLGAQPSGPELRNLLLTPVSLRVLHSGEGGLRPVTRYIGPVTVTEFIGDDGSGLPA